MSVQEEKQSCEHNEWTVSPMYYSLDNLSGIWLPVIQWFCKNCGISLLQSKVAAK